MNTRVSVKSVFCLLSLLLLVLSACSSLTKSDEPAVTSWWLTPYTGVVRVEAGNVTPTPVSVSVTAIPGLDSDRILALTADSILKPFTSARWVEHIPELTSSLIGRSLEASGRFDVVTMGDRGKSERCDLTLEVQEFFANIDSSGNTRKVSVAMNGFYQCGSTRAVPIQLKSSLDVEDNRMKNIVAAFQRAYDGLMKDLLTRI